MFTVQVCYDGKTTNVSEIMLTFGFYSNTFENLNNFIQTSPMFSKEDLQKWEHFRDPNPNPDQHYFFFSVSKLFYFNFPDFPLCRVTHKRKRDENKIQISKAKLVGNFTQLGIWKIISTEAPISGRIVLVIPSLPQSLTQIICDYASLHEEKMGISTIYAFPKVGKVDFEPPRYSCPFSSNTINGFNADDFITNDLITMLNQKIKFKKLKENGHFEDQIICGIKWAGSPLSFIFPDALAPIFRFFRLNVRSNDVSSVPKLPDSLSWNALSNDKIKILPVQKVVDSYFVTVLETVYSQFTLSKSHAKACVVFIEK
jgi:hypothetical protein